ncbi:hypothetical protein CS063_13795 [Sporanaerobium hydrogeniformans]|uniref:Uncharacterized protein n=1 Tax=Sporanaerobium hydrogeniformans TaxID=3072179 RepID=A0AC61DAR6_9FIRM|nr:hypothetical protein [Sporanaerobium hydrogeniformans]PHV69786.1 hypothetical protein CS063_13795 [Sporanaerobium hydrogeniformans]
MSYGYLDKYGILHVVSDEGTAKTYAKNGKYVKTDVANRGGYPCLLKEVVVYSQSEAYIEGNRGDGKKIRLSECKDIEALYKQLI